MKNSFLLLVVVMLAACTVSQPPVVTKRQIDHSKFILENDAKFSDEQPVTDDDLVGSWFEGIIDKKPDGRIDGGLYNFRYLAPNHRGVDFVDVRGKSDKQLMRTTQYYSWRFNPEESTLVFDVDYVSTQVENQRPKGQKQDIQMVAHVYMRRVPQESLKLLLVRPKNTDDRSVYRFDKEDENTPLPIRSVFQRLRQTLK